MLPDPLSIRLQVVPQGCRRIDLHPRENLVRLEIPDAADLHRPHLKERHLPGGGPNAPRRTHDDRDQQQDAQDLPAGLMESLAKAHSPPFSRRRRSSAPVCVMSPAPIVITTSPSRANSASASARSDRAPCQITGCPARSIALATRSDVTPAIGCSRAG